MPPFQQCRATYFKQSKFIEVLGKSVGDSLTVTVSAFRGRGAKMQSLPSLCPHRLSSGEIDELLNEKETK
jgi:hypothetical protein